MEMVINICKESYIKVYGKAKWNSLSDQEKHDVIMILVSEMNKALDRI